MLNRRRSYIIIALVSTVAVAGVTAACSSDGAPGATGQAGAAGQQGTPGTQGPAGNTGSTGALPDGGLSAGCLSPCHGFGGVVAQYQSSVHYATYVNNLNGGEVASWTGATACGNCHAIDGIEQRVAGNVNFSGDGGPANLAHGEIEYKNSLTGSVSEVTYAGSAKVAAVYCTTCHKVTDANDPHKTGIPWTPGSFPFQVPVASGDTTFIEKSPAAGAVTGQSIGAFEESNTCTWCHRSRKDVPNYIKASGNNLSAYWGPHEGPQSDVTSGKGGYQFGANTYSAGQHQLTLTCTDCHMPPVADNQGVPDHSFYPKLSVCLNCHSGATNFDVNSGQTLIRSALTQLRTLLSTAGYLTLDPTGAFELDQPTTATGLTGDQAGALYDYFLVARGGAFGVHNPEYTQALLYDSVIAVGGSPSFVR